MKSKYTIGDILQIKEKLYNDNDINTYISVVIGIKFVEDEDGDKTIYYTLSNFEDLEYPFEEEIKSVKKIGKVGNVVLFKKLEETNSGGGYD